MLSRLIIKSYLAGRKAVVPLAQGCAARLKGLAAQASDAAPPTPAIASPTAAPVWQPASGHAEHTAILAALEDMARLGHVPADALIGRLHAYHRDKLAEDRQRLVALEQELGGHLLSLDARFPEPVSEPEKPQPPRGRSFGPISRDLRRMAGPSTRQ